MEWRYFFNSLFRGEFMNIEQIDSERILISLSDKDMENYSITFETLSLSENNSRKALSELMNRASSATGISFSDKRVMIEALKYEHGCLLLLTVSCKKKKRKVYRIKSCSESYIFMFDSAESFLACTKALYCLKASRPSGSAYTLNGKYFLIIGCSSVLRSKYIDTIREFSVQEKRSSAYAAILHEHAKLLSSANAICEIGSCL